MRYALLCALLLAAFAARAEALETVRGVIRETTEFQCASGCGTYSLDPDSTYPFTLLFGNYRLYVGEHVQITGYRDNCSGCVVLVASEPIVVLPPLTSAGDDARPVPSELRLEQNYPNPFNPSTVMEYALPSAAHVRLSVFNILGQEVALIVDAAQPPGAYRREWSADGLPGGVYLCRLEAGTRPALLRRMLLVR